MACWAPGPCPAHRSGNARLRAGPCACSKPNAGETHSQSYTAGRGATEIITQKTIVRTEQDNLFKVLNALHVVNIQ